MIRMRYDLVSMAAVACMLATTAAAQDSVAQADSVSNSDEVVVTSSRTPTAVSEVPGSISVLSKERLDNQLSVSTDLNDVLGKSLPGLIANNETSFSGGTGPIVRGRPASVLINGVPVNQLLRSSGFDLGLIDPIAIDRIEVNRGASAVFGFGASGGVINLLTRRGRTTTPEVIVNTAASFNPKAFSDSLSARFYAGIGAAPGNGWDYYVGAGYNRERPTHDARGRRNVSQDVSVYSVDANIGRAVGDDGEIRVSGQFFRRDFIQEYRPPAYTVGICNADCSQLLLPAGLEYPNDYFAAIGWPQQEAKQQFQQNIILNAGYKDASFLGQALDVSVLYQKNTLYYAQSYSDGAAVPTLDLFTSPMKNERYGFRSSLTAEIALGLAHPLQVTYGFDYINDSMIRTSEFGGPSRKAVTYNPGINPFYNTGGPNRPISPPVSLAGYAGFAQFKLKFGALIATGGVRHEEARPRAKRYVVENFGGVGNRLIYNGGAMQKFNATLFNGGLVWSVADGSELYVGLSQGVEISELGRAYTGAAQVGLPANPALVNPQAAITTQYEIGFRHSSGPLSATGAIFYTDAPLSAQTVPNPDPACNTPGATPCPLINKRQREQIWGAEATLDFRASDQFSAGAVLTYQDGRYRDDTVANPRFERLTTDRITPTRVSAYAEVRPTPGLLGRLQGTQSFRRGGFGISGPQIPFGSYADARRDVPGFFILDALVEVQALGGTFALSGENVLNKKYLPPLTVVYNDLYDSSYAQGTRVTVGFKRRF